MHVRTVCLLLQCKVSILMGPTTVAVVAAKPCAVETGEPSISDRGVMVMTLAMVVWGTLGMCVGI